MLDALLYLYTVQAARPTCHWWRRPRVCAWFQVLMLWSLVKPPASAGELSRIGEYLLAARGPGLLLQSRRRPTFPHVSVPLLAAPLPLCFIGGARWTPRLMVGHALAPPALAPRPCPRARYPPPQPSDWATAPAKEDHETPRTGSTPG
jgi:hypothetical protein